MKFDKIIHPEVVVGKRGDESIRQVYKELLKDVDYCKDGFTVVDSPLGQSKLDKDTGRNNFVGIPFNGKVVKGKQDGGEHVQACFVVKPRLMALDENSRDHFCIIKKFVTEGGKVFHVNKDFLENLSEIDREIPVECLPERFFGYISFADKTIRDDTGYIQGAYVFIGDGKETCLNPSEWGKKVFWCSYIEEGNSLTVTALRTVLEKKTMQELISELFCFDYKWGRDSSGDITARKIKQDLTKREQVFRTLINTIIYIHCQNPILDKVGSSSNMSLNQRRKTKEKSGIQNDSSFPITFVNWRYKRSVLYSKDRTSVVGHFRRQHYGPGNTLVKAIYIEEHERILNKELVNELTT